MSNAISSALSIASIAGANSPTSVAPQLRQPGSEPGDGPADGVSLTEAQQVYNLYNQGQAVSEIASTLNLSVSAVNDYLGITQGG